ncbi:hypothetical protein CV770_35460 [Bradyrhizobium sp. AC87j1]|uniref:hypothetical protein n=1 Tax=Bradyrhizobium sp. AC87j1 TaxID=2055894 RepID=UPI000CEBD936|nr:hypothetical protein [Bradyrhizobium sp. AC87j1]PPQ14709.1 hypothetical protein CV770_35460 [Bradyrhizobium sp. AC87j1]
MMGNAMINALIAAGVVSAIGYGWITHLQNRGQRRSRAGAGGDGSSSGDTYSVSNNGFSLGSWFSSDSSSSSTDGGSCSSSDSGSSGGDCGGGGDGGGGGGGD